ncbi:hypothetical protein [Roseovarius sp.]|uniref:hypothetical protein n=1 Tax=Roseovarius sp. TaxID=1486281 RepID=UPI003A97F6DE
MFSKITSALMAGALALTAVTATPAVARDRSDNRNLIAGLALGAIVGAAIANNGNNRRDDDPYRGNVSSRDYRDYDHDRYRDDHDRYHGSRHDDRRRFGHERRVNLPGACRVYAGNRAGYSGRCLSHRYGYNGLPSACEVHVGGQHRVIYRDRCLNQYGYY